ncbi:MAG: RsmD family RNA methyltransferase [Planctomycetota bacterium]
MAERLRISGGSRRGRKLISPPTNSIRPASDLVRQAVFNMLGTAIEDVVFYDVFAGTGIVGLEALSRGAKRAIFVEQERRQLVLIKQNLARAGFAAEANVRGSDAFTWGKHFATHGQRSIVFLGPPYPLFEKDLDRMLELVNVVQENLAVGDYLVLQYPRFIVPERLPRPETWFRMRHYGKTRIGIWTPETAGDDTQDVEVARTGSSQDASKPHGEEASAFHQEPENHDEATPTSPLSSFEAEHDDREQG